LRFFGLRRERAAASIADFCGEPTIEPPGVANRGFYPLQIAEGIVDDAGKARYGFHTLRHFFASWLIERPDATPKKVQALLGHSSIQVTYDIYGHLFPNLEDDHAMFAAGELALVKA
jgi:integrase